jgi:hypothetical protein
MTPVAVVAGLRVALSTAAGARVAPRHAPADPFAVCHQRLATAPNDYDSAYCFYTAAFEARRWKAGADVFERLMRARLDNFWLPLALGHLHRNRQPADLRAAEMWYRRAADGFRAAGHAEGEILARSNLRDMLLPIGRVAEASAEVSRVSAIGAAAGDPLLQARAWSLEATHLVDTGGDVGRAYRLLKQAETAVFPNGPYRLRRTALTSLGRAAVHLGRLDEALIYFGRLNTQARGENDLTSQATAQYNILNTELLRAGLLPDPAAKERLLRFAQQTLATGVTASHNLVTLKAHRIIGALFANVAGSRGRALDHVEHCLTLATNARQQQDEAACAWMAAMLLHDTAPQQARAAQRRAISATARANTPVADAFNVSSRMKFSWLTRPRAEAIRDSLAALERIETLRRTQEEIDRSAEAFSTWTLDYYWLLGRLLQDGDVDLAFSIGERLKARTLLDARRDRLAARTDAPFASLDEVQSAIGPDEALLSFQLGIWDTIESTFGGGAWLTVVTRDRRAVYPIPDRAHFAPLVPMFAGLLSGGDGREITAAVRLHDDVFSNALRDLPSNVTRLILVPDGPLHHLPFDALRASAGADPLAARYELVVSPSATVWLDTRGRATSVGRARVLVLADPATDAMLGMGRLPYARRESRALSRYLSDVVALVGVAASEQAIKMRPLRDYELVHFAAHAVADEAHPEQSAVFLAPGGAEDGVLRAREIRDLDLDGRIVVLSACETATGAVLGGEGMLSIARAFFQAGARAVVGTRWRIRDEDAASLFETFYRTLGSGATLSAALAQTKAEAIAHGRSPEMWAGLVLLGDGASRPFLPRTPKPDPRRARMATLILCASIAIATGTLALKRRRRHITPRSVQRAH